LVSAVGEGVPAVLGVSFIQEIKCGLDRMISSQEEVRPIGPGHILFSLRLSYPQFKPADIGQKWTSKGVYRNGYNSGSKQASQTRVNFHLTTVTLSPANISLDGQTYWLMGGSDAIAAINRSARIRKLNS